jgi:hypothetical protein
MDPTANLAEQLELASNIIAMSEAGDDIHKVEALRLAELVEDLDSWLRGGGFLPSDWRKARKP